MNKILKKIAALATTAALFVSVYVPIWAQAATVNSMKTIGTLSRSNPYGYELDVQQIDISGDMAFCIEPNDDMHHNDTYTQNQADSYWRTTLSQNQRDAIGLILYYGYYNGDTSHQSQAYFAATQILLWEVTGFNTDYSHNYANTSPIRDPVTFEFSTDRSGCDELIDHFSARSVSQSGVKTAYNSILRSCKAHNELNKLTCAYDSA